MVRPSPQLIPGPGELDLAWLEEHSLGELDRWSTPGVELVAIKGGDVLFAGGFGSRRVEADLPVTAASVFAHGSTGKAFTSYLVSGLVAEGIAGWDVPVRDYLPELRLPDPVVADRVTLRDLLAHRGGFARHDLAWIANPGLAPRELVGRLRYLPLAHDLRQACRYSNFGYVLAGVVVEALTGATFAELLRARVFEPLGFERTFTSSAEVLALEDHAEPHRAVGGAAVATAWRPLDNVAPAGGVLSCATDTARWLLAQLEGGDTHEPQIALAAADEELAVTMYALGWCTGTYRGRKLVWHNGGVDGFYTEFLLLPEERIAVAACNNAGTLLSGALVRHVADVLLGVEPRDWSGHLRAQVEKAAAEEAPRRVPDTSPSHRLDDYAGAFAHPGYGELLVDVHDGTLAVRLGELALEATYRHYDTWDLRLQTLGDITFTASFQTDPEGSVSAVLVPLEPGLEPIRFSRAPA